MVKQFQGKLGVPDGRVVVRGMGQMCRKVSHSFNKELER